MIDQKAGELGRLLGQSEEYKTLVRASDRMKEDAVVRQLLAEVERKVFRFGQVRGVRDDRPVPCARERREEVALAHLDRHGRVQARYVLARQGRGLGRPLDRDHPLEVALDRERQRDAPTPCPDVRGHTSHPASRIPHPGCVQNQVDQPLGLGARNQGAPVDAQLQRPEIRRPDRICEGHPARPQLDRLAEARRDFGSRRAVPPDPDVAGRRGVACDGSPQHAGLAPRVDDARAVEPPRPVAERGGDAGPENRALRHSGAPSPPRGGAH